MRKLGDTYYSQINEGGEGYRPAHKVSAEQLALREKVSIIARPDDIRKMLESISTSDPRYTDLETELVAALAAVETAKYEMD